MDLTCYRYHARPSHSLGWLGRIAPEKRLDDVFAFAVRAGQTVMVFGVMQEPAYWEDLNRRYPGAP